MKYLSAGGYQSDSLIKLTLGLSLLLLAGFWVTNVALYFMNMDLNPASVVTYYNGSEAEFHPPRSGRSMLEVTHMHLPMFALVLLLLTHLLIFAPMRRGAKVAFILTAFGSALLFEASGWMTRFWHPGFGALKVGTFLIFQGALAYLIVGLGIYVLRGSKQRLFRRRRRVGEPAAVQAERALAGRDNRPGRPAGIAEHFGQPREIPESSPVERSSRPDQ